MPSSLVARVYKARYYPRCSFFDAKEGSNPSYIWKGMMAVQDTLKHGCRRSIGSGTDTVIGSDLWLPEDENPYVQTELHESLRGTPVSSLLKDQAMVNNTVELGSGRRAMVRHFHKHAESASNVVLEGHWSLIACNSLEPKVKVMVGIGLAVKRPLSQLGIIEGTEAPCTSSLTAFTN
nr:uncharacterized protein LOC109147770 [Ipomoea batatas]